MSTQPPEHLVDFEQALLIVATKAAQLTASAFETLPLLEAAGRILAEPVLADRDQPAFRRATRDGFAVRAAELLTGGLTIAGQVRAGQSWTSELSPGTALQIMTGAPVPEGADAVVMVEHVLEQAGRLALSPGRSLAAGENIIAQGAEARAGAEVLAPGRLIGAAEIALAAFCGYPHLRVYARPTVAIVATGDELVELDQTPGPAQIRNSNSYAIAALAAAAGAHPLRLPIARDVLDELRERVAEGRRSDLLLFSGGVSMGDYDLVEPVLRESNAEFFFTGVRMQPGKPVVFGRLPASDGLPARFFFGLPGNPVSTQVTFHCFVEPFLRALAGGGWSGPRWALATLGSPVPAKPGITRLLPARMLGTEVNVVAWQGSGDLAANARANCYVELLPGQAGAEGETVRVLIR